MAFRKRGALLPAPCTTSSNFTPNVCNQAKASGEPPAKARTSSGSAPGPSPAPAAARMSSAKASAESPVSATALMP